MGHEYHSVAQLVRSDCADRGTMGYINGETIVDLSTEPKAEKHCSLRSVEIIGDRFGGVAPLKDLKVH